MNSYFVWNQFFNKTLLEINKYDLKKKEINLT